MATPGHRVIPSALNIAFDYDGAAPAVGSRVEIGANRKAVAVSAIGSAKQIGTVLTVRESLNECVVQTPFDENRQDRVAGENIAAGQFVFGPASEVFQYTPAAPAVHTGTTTSPKTITASTDDVVKIKVGGGASQTVTLTAGTGVTFAVIAGELNAGLTGVNVVIDVAGHLKLVAEQTGKNIEVEAVAHDAYTLLGFTAGIYQPTNASHDPSTVAGLIVVGGNKAATVETLEY